MAHDIPRERAAHTDPLTTSQMRTEYSSALCDTSQMVRVAFYGWDSPLLVESHTATAWEAFSATMEAHQYAFRESAGGTYNCRVIAGTSSYSLHSYGLAVDLNPSCNPHGTHTTDMPAAFVSDVEAIATMTGRQVFQWGNDWSGSTADPMHWQIGATRAELGSGITYPAEGPADMPLNQDDLNAIRAIVHDQIETQLLERADSDRGQSTGVGRATLFQQATDGPKGSAAWTLRRIWEQVSGKDWATIDLDADGIGSGER